MSILSKVRKRPHARLAHFLPSASTLANTHGEPRYGENEDSDWWSHAMLERGKEEDQNPPRHLSSNVDLIRPQVAGLSIQ